MKLLSLKSRAETIKKDHIEERHLPKEKGKEEKEKKEEEDESDSADLDSLLDWKSKGF